jgi:archaellin
MFKNFAKIVVAALVLISSAAFAQEKTFSVSDFDAVVISPHIQVTFQQGTETSVVVESITEPIEKLNIEVKKNTLNIYLDDAKITTKHEKEKTEHYTRNKPIYKGTVAKLIVTYKDLNYADLRGEEKFLFDSSIETSKFRLKIFGESEVIMNQVYLNTLQASLYGESHLEIMQGSVERQKITAYGETTVNTQNVESKETKLTAYGSGTFQLNVADRLKVTSYGEATIVYKGNPDVDKGIIIGETKIVKKPGK